MSFIGKSHRRIHEVYEFLNVNLTFITELFPPHTIKPYSPNITLSKTTFVKPNKAAFQHVAYYLLYCIDSDFTQTNLTCWPVIDSKSEPQFLKELCASLIKLNTMYSGNGIPLLARSHLASPGGYKIAYLLFKISQLSMLRILQRSGEDDVLLSVKITNNQQAVDLKLITNFIEYETRQEIEKISKSYEELMQKAANINNFIEEVYQDTAKLKKLLDKKVSALANNMISVQDLKQLRDQVEQLLEVEKEINGILNLEKCVQESVIEHQQPNILDLNSHFNDVNSLLSKLDCGMICPSSDILQELKVKLDYGISKYRNIVSMLKNQESELILVQDTIKQL